MTRWPLHLLALCLTAAVLSLLFLQEPGFGDDLTYWSFAYDLHDIGRAAWNPDSFHCLRWPVWGACWVIQSLGGVGMTAYAGAAIFYLMAGAVCAFAFGRLITQSPRVAWACALVYLFCPLLDSVCHRPMPDLSESALGPATVLAWLGLMRSTTARGSCLWAALTGLGVYLCESNRLTGVFIALVLAVGTLVWARRHFGWLLAAGAFSLLFYGMEAAVYHAMFGDWLHNLHANLQGKDHKGLGSLPFWRSPFRFLNSLWSEGRLSPGYAVCAVLGIAAALRSRQDDLAAPSVSSAGQPTPVPVAPLIALWFGVLYLEYACAPQSLWPWKPVIREAGRFLAGLAVPMSILAVLGLRRMWHSFAARAPKWERWLSVYPLPLGTAGVLLLAGLTSRPFFNLGFEPKMRAYVRQVPAGTVVFTHDMMRSLAILSDPSSRQRLVWRSTFDILERSDAVEALAGGAQEFWYMRKGVWLNARKRAEDKKNPTEKLRPVSSPFVETEKRWALARVLTKGDDPDLIFYRRRTPAMPAAQVLSLAGPELAGLLPALPADWSPGNPLSSRTRCTIPPSLRGQCLSVETMAASDEVQAATLSLRFTPSARHEREILLRPYLYPQASPDFFVVPIPRAASGCNLHLRFLRGTRKFQLSGLRLVVQTPLDGLDTP